MKTKMQGSAGRGKRAGGSARPDKVNASEASPDPTMKAAVRGVALSAAALTAVALLAFGVRPALGVGAGGAIATVNLIVFARMSEAFLARRGTAVPWGIVGILKLTLLLGGVWLIIRHDIVGAGWLALGYGSLPLGITLGSLFGPKPVDETPPPPPPPPASDRDEDEPGTPPREQDVVDGKPRRPGDRSGDR
jgi:hypothetical protein